MKLNHFLIFFSLFITVSIYFSPPRSSFPEKVKVLQKDYDSSTIERVSHQAASPVEKVKDLLDYQIQQIEKTVEKSQSTLAIDEALRFQLWDMAKTIEFANLYKQEDDALRHLLETAEQWGHKGLAAYTLLTQKIDQQIQAKKEPPVELLAVEPHIPFLAGQYERATHAEEWKKDKAKCGATARALLYYFSQKEGIELEKATKAAVRGIDRLKEIIKFHHTHPQERAVYLCESERLDHVFVIEQTPEGRFHLYQSFVNTYTLKASLAMGETLSYEEVIRKLEDMESLLKAKIWTPQIAFRYEQLFLSKPHPQLAQEFSQHAPDFRTIALVHPSD